MLIMKNGISSLQNDHSIFPFRYVKLKDFHQKMLQTEFYIWTNYGFCDCLFFFFCFFGPKKQKNAKLAKKTHAKKVNGHRIYISYKYKILFPMFFLQKSSSLTYPKGNMLWSFLREEIQFFITSIFCYLKRSGKRCQYATCGIEKSMNRSIMCEKFIDVILSELGVLLHFP